MDLANLIPQFGGFLYTVVSFVVALSIIVAVHEYGHYIVGRWSGIRADVFSIGFGPVLASRVDRHGTRWQIAALPFGGYVKFWGDANAASGADGAAMSAMRPEDLRHTMHGAPLWARTATVAAGPVFNFILSIAVFSAVFLSQGQIRDPLTVGEVTPLPVQQALQPGDVVNAIAGLQTPRFSDAEAWQSFTAEIPHSAPLTYDIIRDGQNMQVQGPYLFPPHVSRVAPRSAAIAAGLKPGDVITAVDGTPIASFDELKQRVESSNGAALDLSVWRAGDMLDITLEPRRVDEPNPDGGFTTQWRIGIVGNMAFEPATGSIGVGEAIAGAGKQVVMTITTSLSGLWHMITGQISTCNMSGPIGIAQTSSAMASQGLDDFIWFVAVLSTAVGLLNLFPIPALDGGHLVFYAYEAVTGKPPKESVMRILMTVGIAIVLSLMVFALSNDVLC